MHPAPFILKKLIRKGSLTIIQADGQKLNLGQAGQFPRVIIRLHDSKLLTKLMLQFTLALGEAYMDGRLTIEEGTLYDLLELFAINYHDAPDLPWEPLMQPFLPLMRRVQQYNPLQKSRSNVAHHYDLSYKLYRFFLDPDLQYSCAYFEHPGDSLETAQRDKKRHIAAKLMLKSGQRVLDIGCGFGGMALYLAKNHGVEVVGLTLSEEQYKIAVERAKAVGLESKVTFRLQDYRHETAQYDRIVSVGMFEHVGIGHYKEFMTQIKRLLTDDGVMLLHSIGRMDGPGTTDAWLRKYIFPGGYAPALSEVLPYVERSGLWATDIEILRLHYAETLKAWREQFNQHRAEIQALYDERFCRMWEFYLIGAELDFRYLSTMVFQLQLSKNINAVPLTRNYMYAATDSGTAP